MKKITILLGVFALYFSCKDKSESHTETTVTTENHLDELYAVMQGSYNSEVQAQVDSTYYNISLHMYPIWEGKGHYLYVEQALNSMQNKPYRQRIYKLNKLTDSTYTSEIYTLPTADSLWIGKWKTPKAFDAISPEDISLKSGCEVVLKRLAKNHYQGKTGDTTCVSTMRGASFARSEVEVLEDKIISWDRGFDAEGNYVWGAEKAGYIFNKLD
ncbi:chromophore lyase CpcT/CpeT [Winogradskyella haliclonae]|uniref:Chromophore lyase CpcT/CpeT 1 n=1 Tax=Winogradskyella haliclonae TaxID=2048558 RepID=A0ABQ2C580_9FLAO|nr:chromophore lyase CpcT/CpeT [Winogradskyella haliclonae]GGI58238.1 chromophore lyase CpcT/CpeT 1 [Winogradskyella haliclonae]